MKAIATWFEREAARERRAVLLEDALLSGRFGGYAWYRLRYFFARFLADSLLHIVRVIFLFNVFSHRTFLVLLVAHAAAGLVTSFWWGALEQQRETVRRLHEAGRTRHIPAEIGRWLTLATWVALLVLAGGLTTIIARALLAGRGFTAGDLYAVAIVVRVALQLVARTFHSGIYALRRIYRPLWTLLVVELVGFAGVVAFWPLLDSWSFPVATIATALITTGLTLHYTLRTYDFLGLAPRRPRRGRRLPRLTVRSTPQFLGAGLSYALMKLDAVLVLGLFAGRRWEVDGVDLFVLFYILSPPIQAGFDWAQLFYFDLKRLESRTLRAMQHLYRRFVSRLAWVVGLVSWIIGTCMATLVYERSLGALYWLLAPFFVSRSLLASIQMQMFSTRGYAPLLASACAWLVGFLLAVHAGEAALKVTVLTATTLVVYALLRVLDHARQPEPAEEEACTGLPDWLLELQGIRDAVRVRAIRFSPAGTTPSSRVPERQRERDRTRRHLALRIAERVGTNGSVTYVAPNRIVWYERRATRQVSERRIVATAAGMVEWFGDTGLLPDGPSALDVARTRRMLGATPLEHPPGDALSIQAIERRFTEMFPSGTIYRPDAPPRTTRGPAFGERRGVIYQAALFARELRASGRRSRVDVTALSVGGQLRLIFVVDRRVDRRLRRRWRRYVARANIYAALRPPGRSVAI